VHTRQKQGLPIRGVYPDQEDGGLGCFIVPNAVLLIKNGPHPETGKKLIDYLLTPAVIECINARGLYRSDSR